MLPTGLLPCLKPAAADPLMWCTGCGLSSSQDQEGLKVSGVGLTSPLSPDTAHWEKFDKGKLYCKDTNTFSDLGECSGGLSNEHEENSGNKNKKLGSENPSCFQDQLCL